MRRRPRPGPIALTRVAVVFVGWSPAGPARACDDRSIPVDATGANILFAVQIQLTGDPLKFGWIIPVTAEPNFAVGSEPRFTDLLAATVPRYSSAYGPRAAA